MRARNFFLVVFKASYLSAGLISRFYSIQLHFIHDGLSKLVFGHNIFSVVKRSDTCYFVLYELISQRFLRRYCVIWFSRE